MGTGYTRQSEAEIAPGNIITAADIEAEFDAIQAAFHGTTGAIHDGTTGEGPRIPLTTSISGVLPVANGGYAGIHKTNGTTAPTVNEDSNDSYAVGSVWIDTTNDIAYVCVDASVGAAVWVRHQVYDAELAALAGLTSAADKGIQFTGSGTAGTYDLTAFAKTILDDANAAAVRSTIGTVIGTDVQAYDAELAALAGLTSAADKGIQFTGSGTAGTYDLTTAGKALLDDADADAQLTTLGVSAFAKTLLDDANAADARTTLGIDASGVNQPLDATLTALAALDGTAGVLVQTGSDAFARRTLTAPAAGITITNPAGTAGNPTLVLANDLAAVEGLSTSGIAVRSASDTWVTREIAEVTGETAVTNANGSAGNISIGLPTALVFTGKTVTGGTFTGGTFTTPTITLLGTTSPTPTTDGDIRWDTDDDRIVVGDGSGQKYFSPNPSTTVDNTVPRFDGTTGQTQTSSVVIDDSNNISGVGTLNATTDLQIGGISVVRRYRSVVSSGSGTTVSLTSIPSWANKITIEFVGVSTTGTSSPKVNIGDSGGLETTGYVSASQTTDTGLVGATDGFILDSNDGAFVLSGHMILTHIGSNIWVSSHSLGIGTTGVLTGGGYKQLSGTLDRVAISTANAFDSGTIGFIVES